MSEKRHEIVNLDYARLVRQLRELPADRLVAFQHFIKKEITMDENTTTGNETPINPELLIKLMVARFKELGKRPEAYKRKLPSGFWTPILEYLAENRITTPDSKAWNPPHTLSSYYKRHQDEIFPTVVSSLSGILETTKLLSSDQEGQETIKQPSSDQVTPARPGQSTGKREPLSPIKYDASEIEKRFEALENSVQALRCELENLNSYGRPGKQAADLTPLPPRDGKTYAGQRGQFATIVDKALLDGMRRVARERRTTLAHVVESAFWLFLGKPRLSLEETEDRQPEHEEK